MKHSYVVGLTLVAVSVVLAGCTNKTVSQSVGETMMEKSIEAQTGGKVDIDSRGDKVTIKTNEGQTQYSAEGGVKQPDGFPKELIVTSDAKLIIASSSGAGSSLTYLTNSDKVIVSEKYINSLTGFGWKKEMETNTGQGTMLNFSKGNQNAFVVIGDNSTDDKTAKTTVNVTYTIEEE